MIWESYYWKKDLLSYAKKLEKRKEQNKWFDSSYANMEKEIMISSFMIRKLFDSDKIDKRLDEQKIEVISYKSNGKKINKMKNIFPDRYFELEKPTKVKIKVRDICNQIIHSYIFNPLMNENNNLQAIWFASDYTKFKQLIELKIENYIDILNQIGNYWSTSEHYIFDDKKGDYEVYHDLKLKNKVPNKV